MQAHNGSGKTTCFTLGMLARVDPAVLAPQALCVCPTRELVVQNQMVLERMGKFTGGWVGAGQGQGVMCVLLVGRWGVYCTRGQSMQLCSWAGQGRLGIGYKLPMSLPAYHRHLPTLLHCPPRPAPPLALPRRHFLHQHSGGGLCGLS